MSHLKERAEKNCLNCNAEVQGKFCHICGQENVKPEETVWHLITHFFNDVTHFDGKFFSTLRYLITKPGFLSNEYKAGRRASYLNPIRMYVFTSAIFFLIFFSVNHVPEKLSLQRYGKETILKANQLDSADFDNLTRSMNNGKPLSRAAFPAFIDSLDKSGGIHFTGHDYKYLGEYDSLIRTGKKKHNWFQQLLVHKEIEINKKYNNDQGEIARIFIGNLLHSFPQMLFVSLPLFAFVLNILYWRRKSFYYASHAIFSIHLYVFVFIMLLLVIGIRFLSSFTTWGWMEFINPFIFIFIFYYQYKSMRNFYRQRRAKTILKFFILNFVMLSVITLLFIVFTLTSILKI